MTKDKLALTPTTIASLIRSREAGLKQWIFDVEPSSIYLEQQTIKALQLLAQHPELLQKE
jgi:hypothetical protein